MSRDSSMFTMQAASWGLTWDAYDAHPLLDSVQVLLS